MRYFLDTEFFEDGWTIDLISLGLVCEDGRKLYVLNQNHDCHASFHDDWVRDNVLLPIYKELVPEDERDLVPFDAYTMQTLFYKHAHSVAYIAQKVVEFCDPSRPGKPEFWGYYADYDWVVFCQLFGRMIDLPKWFPMYCGDLKQLADSLGNPQLPEQGEGEHNALQDALWNRRVHEFLLNHGEHGGGRA